MTFNRRHGLEAHLRERAGIVLCPRSTERTCSKTLVGAGAEVFAARVWSFSQTRTGCGRAQDHAGQLRARNHALATCVDATPQQRLQAQKDSFGTWVLAYLEEVEQLLEEIAFDLFPLNQGWRPDLHLDVYLPTTLRPNSSACSYGHSSILPSPERSKLYSGVSCITNSEQTFSCSARLTFLQAKLHKPRSQATLKYFIGFVSFESFEGTLRTPIVLVKMLQRNKPKMITWKGNGHRVE